MTDKKGIIKNLGKELEEILNNSNTDKSTKILIGKAMDFGYAVGGCEESYDRQNDPYNSSRCIERYERIRKMAD